MRTVKQRWKTLALAAIMALGLGCSATALAAASKKNIMCVRTNTGLYIPVVRVSMMVVPDGASTFEIVVKDGEGATNVESIGFEKHEVEIDLSLYQGYTGDDTYIDMTKPVWLITSNGKYFKMTDVTSLSAREGSSKFDLVTKKGFETELSAVYFFRGSEEQLLSGIEDAPMAAPATERLQLTTPIREQMSLSGCGDATRAQVYSVDGKLQTEAAVEGGNTTIYVGQLPAGVYVVRVGNKALKFTKK